MAVAIAVAVMTPTLASRFRHGSQAYRLGLLALGLVAPTCASYPMLFDLARDARAESGGERATRRRPSVTVSTVQMQLEESLTQIDQLPSLESLVVPTGTTR
jgi:hypothetical protein